jgi:hypothetical protein
MPSDQPDESWDERTRALMAAHELYRDDAAAKVGRALIAQWQAGKAIERAAVKAKADALWADERRRWENAEALRERRRAEILQAQREQYTTEQHRQEATTYWAATDKRAAQRATPGWARLTETLKTYGYPLDRYWRARLLLNHDIITLRQFLRLREESFRSWDDISGPAVDWFLDAVAAIRARNKPPPKPLPLPPGMRVSAIPPPPPPPPVTSPGRVFDPEEMQELLRRHFTREDTAAALQRVRAETQPLTSVRAPGRRRRGQAAFETLKPNAPPS